MTFTKEQIESLKQPIKLENVAERESGWGDKVPYVKRRLWLWSWSKRQYRR